MNSNCKNQLQIQKPLTKSANAHRVLQLMDICEDGGDRYQEFVSQIAADAGITREQLEKELKPFI